MRTDGMVVFKDRSGAYRWIARTTTAYRDRDGEIISEKALEDDAQRMTATGVYGPLRYWHVGQPDPFSVDQPWGPGLDIGDCDYSTVIGRTSIESGTFKSKAIGRAFSEAADAFELSPGFFRPIDQPNAAGEYDAIRRFERSVVPIRHGRASNLFTGLTVKEHKGATPMAPVSIYNKEAAQADQLAAILERVERRQEDRVFGLYERGHFDKALKEARALEVVSYKSAADGTGGLESEILGVVSSAIRLYGKETVAGVVASALESLGRPAALDPMTSVMMSAQKAAKPYQVASDPLAIAAGADQIDQGPRVAGLDLRPR